jgi:putative chitinase
MTTTVRNKINRQTIFNKIRVSLFNGKLSQLQVDGIETILNEWESRGLIDLRWLAYMLATAYHETGHTFQPIEEYGKGKGRKYGIPDPITGHVYYGRGFVQITWKYNYETFSERLHTDLVNNPDRALDCKISTDILFEGMISGLFTGRKLYDYFNSIEEDWINARRIINGKDRAELISNYAKAFFKSLSST